MERAGRELLWPISAASGETSEPQERKHGSGCSERDSKPNYGTFITDRGDGKLDSVRKPERKKSLRRPKRRWENNIK
jgi:hypothetical protein